MLGDGKADAHAIAVCAKICSICAAALSFTIYTFWLVPSKKLLRFRELRDFSTGSLGQAAWSECVRKGDSVRATLPTARWDEHDRDTRTRTSTTHARSPATADRASLQMGCAHQHDARLVNGYH
jgi:hypothetical protein